MTPNKPLWSGRIEGGLAPEAWEFLHSLPHDRFLWPYDIDGTVAHVKALTSAALLSKTEGTKLTRELRAMKDHPELVDDADEDVHSAIERVLTERLGDVGAKVHTGRSRNDQVATAMRLWTKEQLTAARTAVASLVSVLADRATEHADTLAPGYTHMQRAQPIALGHWLCAHAWSFVRDIERFDLALANTDVSPLGAGALATSTFDIDPQVAAAELGFVRTFDNSMDAVSDRDFLVDGSDACTMALTHLSRLAEEIVLWSTTEFAFVVLPDAYATGSSMMPQKRNPDVAEVARGAPGIALGALTGLVTTLKGLPLAYDRDLQLDKQHVRDVFGTTIGAFRAMAGLVAGLTFDTERLASAASDPSLLATDEAERLVREGVPFRKAHEQVAGRIDELQAAGRPRNMPGGPSAKSIRAQVRRLRKIVQT